jgi:pimeloyl-ACP methyl ester carboxylesterase
MTSTCRVALDGREPVEVTINRYGSGRPFLLLHGGAGPQSVIPFAELLAASAPVEVLVPIHPGFGGTVRPGDLTGISALARLYDGLIEQLDLRDVTMVGNSIGGWVAAELALLKSARVKDLILIDAVGIEVPGHPVADFFSMTMAEVFDRTFHNPEPFRIEPATLPPAAQVIAAGNRAALAAYAGGSMSDSSLAQRLATLDLPTLVLWGDRDRIADPTYGRAYAAAIPGARFQLLIATGHAPQLETPEQVLDAIRDSAEPDTVLGGP